MALNGRRAQPMTAITVAFGDITASYANAGSATPEGLFKVKFVNGCDTAIWVSIDGSNDHFFVLPTSPSDEDLQDKAVDKILQLPKSTQFRIKYDSAPSSGKFVIQGWYIE